MPRVAVAAAWLCQLEPEHRLGETGPWSHLEQVWLFSAGILCFCACVEFCCFPAFCRETAGCQGNGTRASVAPGLS